MSEHLETVQFERSKYPATEYGPSGEVLNPIGLEASWTITNAVAYRWRGEGWGLLSKPAGSNWAGYSTDVLINLREEQAVDVLGDSGGAARAQWSPMEWESRFVDLWRPPVAPDNPDPDPPPITNLEARVTQLERDVARMRDAMRDAGAALDSV